MTRKQLSTLGVPVLLGLGASYFLQATRPLGRSVADPTLVSRMLMDRGSPYSAQGDGELTVVVFTDYQCPARRKADPALRRAVTGHGNVRVVYRDWPIFGERSERAAKVASAAHRQGIYSSVHQRLMKSLSFEDSALRDAVEREGGNWGQIEADLVTHGTEIEDQLDANRMDAFALGRRGTPGYLIGSVVVEGALTEPEFRRLFEKAHSWT